MVKIGWKLLCYLKIAHTLLIDNYHPLHSTQFAVSCNSTSNYLLFDVYLMTDLVEWHVWVILIILKCQPESARPILHLLPADSIFIPWFLHFHCCNYDCLYAISIGEFSVVNWWADWRAAGQHLRCWSQLPCWYIAPSSRVEYLQETYSGAWACNCYCQR